ncbi:restriction endonuclease [Chamaesiphon polymorphus]|uniref:Restriction endonuclease n=1 Tax=Chamaesiphon polymorphus CCALA 037 TaxID=2107692 RepID=A0A2T1FZ27_9CYAN|nr:restriction endonuclease [Chamaesiphon polymorphus]PSB50253.1 restriction endonuclease [Chamaesiphon polymorphus CCALA 037]
MKPTLTIEDLCAEAAKFAEIESLYDEPVLYGVTDGKAVGTYLEHKFIAYLAQNYSSQQGNSASGIDLPDLEVDIKVTSVKQPQSSCPFRSATQKVFGLGYHLLIFVYDKYDDSANRTGRLNMQHTIFVDRSKTADFQTTKGIIDILNREGNHDDIIAFIMERNLPVDEIGANQLAERIIDSPPNQGYLTISNALQWRLQYSRVIQQAGSISGIFRIR